MHLTVYALVTFALRRFFSFDVVLCVVCLILLSYIFKRILFISGLSAIPGPGGIPVLGNSLSLTGGQDEFFRLLVDYKKKYGPIFKLWIGMRPFVFISSADLVGPILNSSVHIDKSYEYTFLKSWLGTGLVTATGSKWHKRRKMLTPAFHYSILEEFVDPIVKKANLMVKLLEKEVDQAAFNIVKYSKLCALDIICVTAMGKDIQAQLCEGKEYVRAVDGLTVIVQRRFITPWLKPDFIFKRSPVGKQQKIYIETINEFVTKVIQEKKSELKKSAGEARRIKKHRAFLDLILEAAGDGETLSDADVKEEVNTFMFAGHDTTSAAISWCLYALGRHIPAQKKILEEYERVIEHEVPTYKELQKLEYLEMCIKETMRLYPVVPLIARDIKHKVEVGENFTLLPGVTVLIFTHSLHRDPKVFENPDEFRPERFQQNDVKSPFSYIPFSAGPRNCIGAKFAMMELKIVIHSIVKNYEIISVDSEEELNMMSEIVLSNKDGVRIILRKRQKTD